VLGVRVVRLDRLDGLTHKYAPVASSGPRFWHPQASSTNPQLSTDDRFPGTHKPRAVTTGKEEPQVMAPSRPGPRPAQRGGGEFAARRPGHSLQSGVLLLHRLRHRGTYADCWTTRDQRQPKDARIATDAIHTLSPGLQLGRPSFAGSFLEVLDSRLSTVQAPSSPGETALAEALVYTA
jgi:hypothetical protein